MLDSGTLYDLVTNENIEERSSKTFEIDWENNRLPTRRIDGLKAIAQACEVALNVDFKRYPMFSELFGNEFYQYIGKDPDLLKCNAERLVKECLAPDLRIDKITDFKITDIDKYTIYITFTVHCAEGSFDMSKEVEIE